MESLSFQNVSVVKQNKILLNDLSVTLESNHIYGLLGSNGAGKTTLFKMILGLVPHVGSIFMDNQLLDVASADYLRVVGVCFPLPESWNAYTIEKVLNEHLFYMGVTDEKFLSCLKLLNLNLPLQTKIASLSLGMKQKLNLALALSHAPKILLLDEPFNGLDREGIISLKTIIQECKHTDTLIVISSHSFRELDDLIDTAIVMNEGQILSVATTENLARKGVVHLEEFYHLSKEGYYGTESFSI